MKSLNGVLLMIAGVFLLWIGVTGRFPKLVEAIGLVRGSNPNQSASKSTAQKSGSTPSSSTDDFTGIRLTPSTQKWFDDTIANLNKSQTQNWAEATGKAYSPAAGGASGGF